MPKIEVDDGCKINVEVEGPADAPALMLSNSLGTNLHMWDRRPPNSPSNTASSATTAAVTAGPTCRKAPTRWSASAAT